MASSFKENIIGILRCKETTDISFDVGGRIFRAHKVFVSAQSVFFDNFFSGHEDHMKVDDLTPEVFEKVLLFLYTRAVEDCNQCEDYCGLIQAAVKYGIQNLKFICEARLYRNINSLTVLRSIEVAQQFNCAKLWQGCISYVIENMDNVVFTKKYIALMHTCPAILDSLAKASELSERKSVHYKHKINKRI
ncbi:hypothetical protein LUZ61_015528 [Rhynchospora tenuis]|uniref:BTB domain-containing protein n=1 Tax=Rhynchospora tenuis TaxID=198213 RepID=A0AAD5Z3T1_9POAL|nr:hypothetical protein LUZ61_015528 [Rhynchospora tenuis]